MEPHVYALDVEAMAALREESRLLALLELGQADGALERLAAALLGVGEDGEAVENRRVESVGCSGGSVDVEDEVRAAVVTVSAEEAAAAASGPEEVPASIKVE